MPVLRPWGVQTGAVFPPPAQAFLKSFWQAREQAGAGDGTTSLDSRLDFPAQP